MRASSRLHDQLFNRVMRTPVSFFDATPLGRIINRFSRDMDESKSSCHSCHVVSFWTARNLVFQHQLFHQELLCPAVQIVSQSSEVQPLSFTAIYTEDVLIDLIFDYIKLSTCVTQSAMLYSCSGHSPTDADRQHDTLSAQHSHLLGSDCRHHAVVLNRSAASGRSLSAPLCRVQSRHPSTAAPSAGIDVAAVGSSRRHCSWSIEYPRLWTDQHLCTAVCLLLLLKLPWASIDCAFDRLLHQLRAT